MELFPRDPDKKRGPSSRFHDNYVKIRRPADNKRGYKYEYAYSGDWYIWTNPPEAVRRLRLLCTALIPAALVIFITAAFWPAELNISNLAVIPSMGSLIFLVLMAYCLIQFYRLPGDMRMTVFMFKDLYIRFRAFSLAGCIFLAAYFAVGIYMLATTSTVTAVSVLLPAAYLLCAASCGVVFAGLLKLDYETAKNDLARS